MIDRTGQVWYLYIDLYLVVGEPKMISRHTDVWCHPVLNLDNGKVVYANEASLETWEETPNGRRLRVA